MRKNDQGIQYCWKKFGLFSNSMSHAHCVIPSTLVKHYLKLVQHTQKYGDNVHMHKVYCPWLSSKIHPMLFEVSLGHFLIQTSCNSNEESHDGLERRFYPEPFCHLLTQQKPILSSIAENVIASPSKLVYSSIHSIGCESSNVTALKLRWLTLERGVTYFTGTKQ